MLWDLSCLVSFSYYWQWILDKLVTSSQDVAAARMLAMRVNWTWASCFAQKLAATAPPLNMRSWRSLASRKSHFYPPCSTKLVWMRQSAMVLQQWFRIKTTIQCWPCCRRWMGRRRTRFWSASIGPPNKLRTMLCIWTVRSIHHQVDALMVTGGWFDWHFSPQYVGVVGLKQYVFFPGIKKWLVMVGWLTCPYGGFSK